MFILDEIFHVVTNLIGCRRDGWHLCCTKKGRTKQPCPRSTLSSGPTGTMSMAMLAPSTSSKACRTCECQVHFFSKGHVLSDLRGQESHAGQAFRRWCQHHSFPIEKCLSFLHFCFLRSRGWSLCGAVRYGTVWMMKMMIMRDGERGLGAQRKRRWFRLTKQ